VAEGTFRKDNPDNRWKHFSLLRLVPALIILSRENPGLGLAGNFLAGTRISVSGHRHCQAQDRPCRLIAIGAMILTPLANDFAPGHSRHYLHLCRLHTAMDRGGAHGLYRWIYSATGMRHIRITPCGARVTLLYFAWVRQKIGKERGTLRLPPA